MLCDIPSDTVMKHDILDSIVFVTEQLVNMVGENGRQKMSWLSSYSRLELKAVDNDAIYSYGI